MATFEQNLAKIRGQAVYGPEMREAIAEALEQADDSVQQDIAAVGQQIEDIQEIVDSRELYVEVSDMGSGDYLMEIVHAEQQS